MIFEATLPVTKSIQNGTDKGKLLSLTNLVNSLVIKEKIFSGPSTFGPYWICFGITNH